MSTSHPQPYEHEKSLINDMLRVKGCHVRDIYGYVSREFGDPVFKITRVVFDTDQTIDVEGEHELPYIADFAEELLKFPASDE